jgi:hypothetical protein
MALTSRMQGVAPYEQQLVKVVLHMAGPGQPRSPKPGACTATGVQASAKKLLKWAATAPG